MQRLSRAQLDLSSDEFGSGMLLSCQCSQSHTEGDTMFWVLWFSRWQVRYDVELKPTCLLKLVFLRCAHLHSHSIGQNWSRGHAHRQSGRESPTPTLEEGKGGTGGQEEL